MLPSGWFHMLLKVQDRIRECLHLAGDDAGKRAAQATDPAIKADFSTSSVVTGPGRELRFVEQVERFADDAKLERLKQ